MSNQNRVGFYPDDVFQIKIIKRAKEENWNIRLMGGAFGNLDHIRLCSQSGCF